MTGRIIIDLFTTLDGVAQAPGGPEEDTADGFPFGGWQAGVPDDAVGRWVMDGMSTLDAAVPLLSRTEVSRIACVLRHPLRFG